MNISQEASELIQEVFVYAQQKQYEYVTPELILLDRKSVV